MPFASSRIDRGVRHSYAQWKLHTRPAIQCRAFSLWSPSLSAACASSIRHENRIESDGASLGDFPAVLTINQRLSNLVARRSNVPISPRIPRSFLKSGAPIGVRSPKRDDSALDPRKSWAGRRELQRWIRGLREPINSTHFGANTRTQSRIASYIELCPPLSLLRLLISRQETDPAAIKSVLDRLFVLLAPDSHYLTGDLSSASIDFKIGSTIMSERSWVLLDLFLALVVQAIDHAPVLLDRIVACFAACSGQFRRAARMDNANVDSEALTFVVNALIRILSRAPRQQPLQAVHLQMHAVTELLRFMTSTTPPLDINREGYQSIASLQLRLPKTDKERLWAHLKSKSWPPYKEDRTGMDTAIGVDQGVSTAGQTLSQMAAIGYKPRGWERLATVFSGWDVDGSPTIQTRRVLEPNGDSQQDAQLWAARVETTRTIREAWAAYLVYQDSGAVSYPEVHCAMICKILQEDRRVTDELKCRPSTNVKYNKKGPTIMFTTELPGDHPRTFASPTSIHDETYVRTAPPVLQDFVEHLLSKKVRLPDKSLAPLLKHTRTWEQSCELLRLSENPSFDSMVNVRPAHLPSNLDRLKSSGGSPILSSAILRVYLRFAGRDDTLPPLLRMRLFTDLEGNCRSTFSWMSSPVMPLQEIRRLISESAARGLIEALARGQHLALFGPWSIRRSRSNRWLDTSALSARSGALRKCTYHLDRIAAFHVILALQGLQIGTDSHEILDLSSTLLIGATTAQAAQMLLNQLRPSGSSPSGDNEIAARIAQETLSTIRQLLPDLFFGTVYGHAYDKARDAESTVPDLLLIPHPHEIHNAVRAFGQISDHESLLATLSMVKTHWTAIRERAVAEINGLQRLRKTFIAARLYAEVGGMAGRRDVRNKTLQAMFVRSQKAAYRQRTKTRMEVIRTIRVLANEMDDEIVGWPSDEEVVEYIWTSRLREVADKPRYIPGRLGKGMQR